ncbi:MAG: DNA polymerase IV [Tissierellia bacterium]|nr:DNA polymerase IV [Tissierellia bacterium]
MRDDGLNFLHVDLDAFFASVEEIENPSLKGKPMVVGGKSDRGIITTANYEARKYGLHSAMPIFMAKSLCPNVIIVSSRHDKYTEYSHKVFNILKRYSPNIEKMSIDEGCMDISHLKGKPEDIARHIQENVYRNTGLTLSIGISYNKFLAKLASDWNKPKGMMIITEDMIPELLLDLKIEKIAGIGSKTAERFHQLGMHKVSDLMELSRESLVMTFGKRGDIIYDRIRGIDHSVIETDRERKSIGIERTFSKDITSRSELNEKLSEFARDLVEELEIKGKIGKTVSIKIKYNDFKTITRSVTLMEYDRNYEDILSNAVHLLDGVSLSKSVRLLGLTMSNLRDDDQIQLKFL